MRREPVYLVVLVAVLAAVANAQTTIAARSTTAAPRAGSTTAPPATTTSATATPVPSPSVDAFLGSDTLDVRLNAWADDLLPEYISTFARVSKLPPGRISVQPYGGVSAVEFGGEYILTLRVLNPTNVSADTLSAVDAAIALESSINDAVAIGDDDMVYGGVLYARRVLPAVRKSVTATLSVNYAWVAFLLVAVFMVGVAAVAMLRRRRSTSSEEHAFDAEEQYHVPRDTSAENAIAVMKLAESSRRAELAKINKERDQLRYAPTARLFIDSLQHDYRLRLPPEASRPDPLALPSHRVAEASKLSSAAATALQALHEEVAEGGGLAMKRLGDPEAAVIAPETKPRGTKALRHMHEELKRLDDAEL